MITVSAFLVFTCLLLSAFLLVEFVRTRKRLYSRIVSLAPGSAISDQKRSARRLRKLVKHDAIQIDLEITELVEMLVAVLLAGESLFLALRRISEISTSRMSQEIAVLLKRVELGGDLTGELAALCERVPTDSVRELSNKLSLALARGTPLANSLSALGASLRAKRASGLLRRAGVNETKMLIPVVLLICPVTVIFALYPSSQYLAAGFI